ncbi:hypothetical protein AB0K14_28980 [Actinosynnema sp. NPDC050801]|uniref:hypothetical protein n=1 Tax=unclassified Actinosynnema TaxID=2637065 RepID=UPI003410F9B3
MDLYLINDLPLMGACADEQRLDAHVRRVVRRQAEAVPAVLTWLDFAEFERLWARTAAVDADCYVLVGTRPVRLWARDPARAAAKPVVHVRTTRVHDDDGRTGSVRLADDVSGLSGRICVLDDVLMSGLTIRAVVDGCGGRPEVRVVVGTAAGVRSLSTVDVSAQVLLTGEPVVDVTVIFLADLLHGSLRGKPFLDQRELLRPFLGPDLEPWRRLRDDLVSGGHWAGPSW